MRVSPIAVVLFVILAATATAQLNAFYTFRMNFPLNESRVHLQTINYTGLNLTATVPTGFNVTNHTGGGTLSGSTITWGNGTGRIVNFTLASPATCIEGSRYTSDLSVNGTVQDEFIFVCIPDDKVVDYKAEYGHGCGNYLTEPIINNGSITLFNLIRVWNIGQYLSGNEDARNANINCTFPRNFTVRTYGHTDDVLYSSNAIATNFNWNYITGGYWFRIAVLSQDLATAFLPVGSRYNVTCGELTYTFDHHRVVAPFPNQSLLVRTAQPLIMGVLNLTGETVFQFQNTEQYDIRDVEFLFEFSNTTDRNFVSRFRQNQTVSFRKNFASFTNVTASFVPPWYENCFNEVRFSQHFESTGINLPPTITTIGNQTACVNTTFTLQVSATDPNGDTSTFTDNATLFNISSSGLINFTPVDNDTGIHAVRITATDPFALSDTEDFNLNVTAILGLCAASLNLTANATIATVPADANGSYLIRIHNNGTATGTYNLSLTSTDATAILNQTTLTVFTSQTRSVIVRANHSSTGLYNITVNATLNEAASTTAGIVLQLNVTTAVVSPPPATPPPSGGGGGGGGGSSAKTFYPTPTPTPPPSPPVAPPPAAQPPAPPLLPPVVAPRAPPTIPLREFLLPFLLLLLLLLLLILLLGFIRARKPHKPGVVCIFHGAEEEHYHPRSPRGKFHTPTVREWHRHDRPHLQSTADQQVHGSVDVPLRKKRSRKKTRQSRRRRRR